MDDAQDRIALLHRIHDHADRKQVVYLLERLILLDHLAVDAVEVLRPAVQLRGDPRFFELFLKLRQHVADIFLLLFALLIDLPLETVIRLGLKIFEAQILKLPLDLRHTEPVSEGRVDLERFACFSDLRIRVHVLKRTHIVQPVYKFDNYYAYVRRHRKEHLSQVFGLELLLRGHRDMFQFRDAVDKVRYVRSELFGDRVKCYVGILHRVVQHAGNDGREVHIHVGKHRCHSYGMDNERFSGFAFLPFMCRLSQSIRLIQQKRIRVRIMLEHLFLQLFIFFFHGYRLTSSGGGNIRPPRAYSDLG